MEVRCADGGADKPETDCDASEEPFTVADTVAPSIHYTVSLEHHRQHLVEIVIRLPAAAIAGRRAIELDMPAWTPGSYKIREYARLVEGVVAYAQPGGDRLAVRKLDKQRWRIAFDHAGALEVRYRVYANEPSVRTSAVDDARAFLHGAGTFLRVRELATAPITVRLEALPPGWQVATALEPDDEGTLCAIGYDALIDAPLLIAPLEHARFDAAGRPHDLFVAGAPDLDLEALTSPLRRMVEAAARIWGGLPYRRYTFLLLAEPGVRGGLEHADSAVIGLPRRLGWREPKRLEDLYCLLAHEHFHAWNGKRLRPEGLGPFDYAAETWTDTLWAVEGVTSYYELVVARRAGVIDAEAMLTRLARLIERVSETPGRKERSLADASFDTWTTFYIRDEHTPNRTVSYYDKGALVTWLLDLEIRRRTNGAHAFDDVLRRAYARFGPTSERGYRAEELEALIDEVAGGGLGPLLDRWIRGTEDPCWERALAPFGMTLRRSEPGERAWLGLRLEADGRRIKHVLRESPAWRAGLSGGDELIAMDGLRLEPDTLAARLEYASPGERCAFTLFRGDRLLTIPVQLGSTPRGQLEICVERKGSGAWSA